MATTEKYISFVQEKIEPFGVVRVRKMFGEYILYLADKPILSVCDNCVYVKKLPQLATDLAEAECGFPYEGAKECYILDIEDRELLDRVIPLLVQYTPQAKSKKEKV